MISLALLYVRKYMKNQKKNADIPQKAPVLPFEVWAKYPTKTAFIKAQKNIRKD